MDFFHLQKCTQKSKLLFSDMLLLVDPFYLRICARHLSGVALYRTHKFTQHSTDMTFGNRTNISQLITARIPKEWGRYYFHRCVSVQGGEGEGGGVLPHPHPIKCLSTGPMSFRGGRCIPVPGPMSLLGGGGGGGGVLPHPIKFSSTGPMSFRGGGCIPVPGPMSLLGDGGGTHPVPTGGGVHPVPTGGGVPPSSPDSGDWMGVPLHPDWIGVPSGRQSSREYW